MIVLDNGEDNNLYQKVMIMMMKTISAAMKKKKMPDCRWEEDKAVK